MLPHPLSSPPLQALLAAAALAVAAPSALAKETYMVPMSDGTLLATDVHLPPFGQPPWPVLLERTPYNKDLGFAIPLWRLSGYAVVVQDLRGRFASQGVDRVFVDDAWGLSGASPAASPRTQPPQRDGFDTVQWIKAQDWCDGHVGTLGASAMGIVQNYLAGTPGNGVDCQRVEVAFTDPYAQCAYQGGAFRKSLVENWLEGQGSLYMLPIYQRHSSYDRLWQWSSLEQRVELVEQPALSIGGWYDIYSLGTIHNFVLRQDSGGAGARGRQKLIIGPWIHYYGSGHVGELLYPDAGFSTPFSLVGSDADWFAYWLKEEANGIFDLPPVAYYQMGPTDESGPWNEWRALDSWPPPGLDYDLYLDRSGALLPTPSSADSAALEYTYDPANPVPTLGGANLFLEMGPYDQSSLSGRADVLAFRTEPLQSAVSTAGSVQVDLWASSDALDTDFTAKLLDIYPDGRAMLVADGILRARFRNGFDHEELLTPGEPVPLTIDLWQTAITFGPGHRIGVDVSSSNYPRFDANPNTGEPIHFHTHEVVARNRVYLDSSHPSRLRLRRLEE
jgi:predicted acyl esterase